jgi:Tol biopolymer transport system component
MDDLAAGAPSQAGADAEPRLESWKAIAAYMGRGVTTVQRWEREEGLPVRRHAHSTRGSVFAFRREIEAWRSGREAMGLPTLPAAAGAPAAPVTTASDDTGAEAAAPARRRPTGTIAAASAGMAAIVALSAAAWWPAPRATAAPPVLMALAARTLSTDAPGVDRPSLSPDGTQLVYSACGDVGCRLFAQPTAGGPAREIPIDAPRPGDRVDDFPRWSPDGSTIAFLREVRNSIWELRLVAATGGASRTLLTMSTGAMSWLPDGAALAVLDRPSQTEPFSAYLVSASTGARLRRLTTPPAGTFGDWQCDVSPDGRQLALVRYRTAHHADIWVVDLETGVERRLATGMNGIEGVAWAADTGRVVFSAIDAAGPTLWTIGPQPGPGEKPVRVAGSEGIAKAPTAARRPARGAAALAFVNETSTFSLWRWHRGASPAPRRLTTSRTSDRQPSLSPDGRKVAFVSSRSGAPEIWVDAIDGGAPRQLTFRGEPVATPRWSPDGATIVYASWNGDNQDVYSVRADGGQSPWRVTFEASIEDNPSWSRDGRSVYFRSDRDATSRIYRIPSSGGPAVPVTQGEGSEARESFDGTLIYFVRSRTAPGLWSVPAAGGTETFVVPRVWEGFWDVTAEGVVAWQHDGRAQTEPVALRLLDGRGGGRDLGTLPTPFAVLLLGVSASRDGQVLSWATNERQRSAIMVSTQPAGPAPLSASR